MITQQIILASSSPRRKQLLQQIGITPVVMPINIDEAALPQEEVTDYLYRMVRQKALAAKGILAEKNSHHTNNKVNHNQAYILTADTIGILDGQILQKPTDKADAFAMWQRMSGRIHLVSTAVQLTSTTTSWYKQCLVTTQVEFITLTTQQMADYWHSGEPQDKAGGYAIQGRGGAWVKSINGSYSNVVGLPLVETLDLLQAAPV